jgi:hypothetical protein
MLKSLPILVAIHLLLFGSTIANQEGKYIR